MLRANEDLGSLMRPLNLTGALHSLKNTEMIVHRPNVFSNSRTCTRFYMWLFVAVYKQISKINHYRHALLLVPIFPPHFPHGVHLCCSFPDLFSVVQFSCYRKVVFVNNCRCYLCVSPQYLFAGFFLLCSSHACTCTHTHLRSNTEFLLRGHFCVQVQSKSRPSLQFHCSIVICSCVRGHAAACVRLFEDAIGSEGLRWHLRASASLKRSASF